MNENLNAEFWEDLSKKYPMGTKRFYDWLERYKLKVDWIKLFWAQAIPVNDENGVTRYRRRPEFSDLPKALQIGIWIEFRTSRRFIAWNVDLTEIEWADDITAYCKKVHKNVEKDLDG